MFSQYIQSIIINGKHLPSLTLKASLFCLYELLFLKVMNLTIDLEGHGEVAQSGSGSSSFSL